MRFTIRGRRATIARRDVRTYGLTRAGSWRIDCDAARLEHGRPVHRERVRFGAWEARPSGRASDGSAWLALPAEVRAAFLDKGREIARSAGWGREPAEWTAWNFARAMHSIGRGLIERLEPPAPVPVEGLAIPGPQNTYKCEVDR